MAAPSEQERAQEQAWRQRQAAPLNTLPEYSSGGNETEQGGDAGQSSDEENQEVESVEDMDRAKQQLYQDQLAARKKETLAQSAAAEEQEQGEGEAQEPSKDNMVLFAASLFLAAVKDLLDLIGIETAGLLGTFINLFIGGSFALILLLRGSKLNNSKTIIRYIIAGIAEFIPVVNFLPMWTISVIWEKLEKKLPANMQVISKVAGGSGQKNLPSPK